MQVEQQGPPPPEPMEIWDDTNLELVAPWPMSVLGRLRKVASKLSQRYPWEPSTAAWFVLTGDPPGYPHLPQRVRARTLQKTMEPSRSKPPTGCRRKRFANSI